MKRFVIFLGIGPLIGFAVFLITLNLLYRPMPIQDYAQYTTNLIEAIPFAYALGFLPALISAGIDWLLRQEPWRIALTTLVGGVGGSMLGILPYLDSRNPGNLLFFAVVGAIPAAVCSLLSTIREVEA